MWKKIIGFLKKIKSSLTINMNKFPTAMTVIMLVMLNTVIVLVAAGVAMILEPNMFANYFMALVSAVKWLVVPNSILTLNNVEITILAGIVTLVGMVLFSGTIIAMTTNSLKKYLFKKAEAKGKLNLDEHYVILNYNSKVPEILANLIYNNVNDTVLILSDKSKDEVQSEFMSVIVGLEEKPNCKLNLIVRKGDPFSMNDLTDVCISKAKNILILDSEENFVERRKVPTADVSALKLTLLVGGLMCEKHSEMIVEANAFETVEMLKELSQTVECLKNVNIVPFSFNRKLGQILSLSALCPEIADLYSDLLSYRGSSFYTVKNIEVDDYMQNYDEAIPILKYGERTFVLSSKPKKLYSKRKLSLNADLQISKSLSATKQELELFIIGSNKKKPYMIDSLQKSSFKKINIREYDKAENGALIRDLQNCKKNKMVLILSDDCVKKELFDTNVFMTLLELQKVFGKKKEFKVIAEILDSRNVESIKNFNVYNIVVSNKLISYFISQILTNRDSKNFFESMFVTEGDNNQHDYMNIWTTPIYDVIEKEDEVKFKKYSDFIYACYNAFNKKLIPIGYRRNSKNYYFCDALDKKQEIDFLETDKLIYIVLNEKTDCTRIEIEVDEQKILHIEERVDA